jgi:ABC-type nitrate/sulfonate/bicarbonate transport system substrate-binding protein
MSSPIRTCALAAALALLPVLAQADPVRLRVSWAVAPAQFTPLIVDTGVTRHHGKSYTLEHLRTPSSAVSLQALNVGELEIATFTFTQLGPAIQNAGMTDLRIIGDDFRDGTDGHETNLYMVRNDSPIQKVQDLKGKVTAVPTIGSGMDVFMRVMLRKHGLEYLRDYTIIETAFPTMGPILLEKKADLVVGVKPFTLAPAMRNGARTLFTQVEAVGPTDMVFFVGRDEWLKKHRAAVIDFFEDFIRASRWFADPANHEKAVQIASNFTKIPPQQLGTIFTKQDFYRDPDARPDIESIQRNVNMLREFGFLKSDIDVHKHADLSYVEEAARRLK